MPACACPCPQDGQVTRNTVTDEEGMMPGLRLRTWSTPAGLGCSFAGDAAIDGTGDALALCEGSNAEGQETFDATRLAAGGTWSAPQVLSTDEIVSLTAAASNAGTFVVGEPSGIE